MDETALAVLVFDAQKEDLFETLGQWDRDLTRASRKEFAKLLVAGRVDAGGLHASRSEVEKFAHGRKFRGFLETSAKKNLACEELKQAILAGINWDEIPCRTTEVLFKWLKEEIIRLKDEGRVLMRFNELRETLQLRSSGEFKRFADEELRAVLTLLAGPSMVRELNAGWTGIREDHLKQVARKGGATGPPGVIVIASGAGKAAMVIKLVQRGLVNQLVIDSALAQALRALPVVSRVKPAPGRRK